jgi:adenine specific DNA methylase Mod
MLHRRRLGHAASKGSQNMPQKKPKEQQVPQKKCTKGWKMMEVVVVKTFGNGQVAAAQNTAHMKIQRQEIIIAALPKKCFEARRHLPW